MQRRLATESVRLFLEDRESQPTHLDHLARFYQRHGHPEQSEPLYHEMLALYQQKYGPRHPKNQSALHTLAQFYEEQERFDEAARYYQEAVEVQREAWANGQYETTWSCSGETCEERVDPLNFISALQMFACFCQKQKQYEQAEALLQEAIALCQLPSDSYYLTSCFQSLAQQYAQQERWQDRLEALGRVYQLEKESTSPLWACEALREIAEAYRKLQQPEQAEAAYLQVFELYRVSQGEEDRSTVYAAKDLADFYREQGEFAKAEALHDFEVQHQKREAEWDATSC